MLLFPAVLMLFALGMEKVQARTDQMTSPGDNVEDFLAAAEAQHLDATTSGGRVPAHVDDLTQRRVG